MLCKSYSVIINVPAQQLLYLATCKIFDPQHIEKNSLVKRERLYLNQSAVMVTSGGSRSGHFRHMPPPLFGVATYNNYSGA